MIADLERSRHDLPATGSRGQSVALAAALRELVGRGGSLTRATSRRAPSESARTRRCARPTRARPS
jgi:hypothetical protein